ncbi:MAG: ABC transporter permease [Propionibacteriaceae bacterium]|nr:ABC transporter permease [Propionibacteriaceae bacterium]
MRYLVRKLLRDIRHSAGQHVAITLVILIGVACYVGMMSASTSVGRNIDDFYATQKLADLWVTVPSAGPDIVSQIGALPGVAAAESRVSITGTSGTHSFAVHTITPDPTVNIPAMDTGHLPDAANQCIVDRGYAAANHLGIGSTITVTLNQNPYDLIITGIFNSPEYLYLAKDITAQPDHLSYGALFVSPDLLPATLDNEIVVAAQPGADLAELKTQITSIALPTGQGVILDRTQLLSWTMLDQDIRQYAQIGAVFPVIFFLVAAVIIVISMSKNVETQRTQIGNMKALGIRSSLITVHYLSYTLLTCLVGCVLGVLAGIWGVMPGIDLIFTTFYTMPALHASGYAGNVVVACVLAFIFGIVATIVSVRKPLRQSPAAAMRPKPPRSTRPILMEKVSWLWSRMSFGSKIVWRNLFLNKGRAALSSVGIIGCVGLLLASFSFLDSIDSVLGSRFYQANQYDVAVTLNSPVATGTAFPLSQSDITSAEPAGSLPATFDTGTQVISTTVTALDTGSTALALYDGHNARVAIPSDGVIIPQLYANTYHLAVGDTMDLTLTPISGTPTPVKLHVSGIAMQYLEQNIYTSFTYLTAIGVAMPVSTYYLTVTSGNASTVATTLSRNPDVASAMTITDLANAWSSDLTIMNSMVWIMIAASAVLALTVVYNISAINILERQRDIATVKVMGYHRREVNRLVFRENLLITAFGTILGLPVGVGMLWAIIQAVVSNTMMVPMVISPLSVVYAIVLGFAFTILANQMLRGKIGRIDMVESLKSVE